MDSFRKFYNLPQNISILPKISQFYPQFHNLPQNIAILSKISQFAKNFTNHPIFCVPMRAFLSDFTFSHYPSTRGHFSPSYLLYFSFSWILLNILADERHISCFFFLSSSRLFLFGSHGTRNNVCTYYLGAASAADMRRTLTTTANSSVLHCRVKFILQIENQKQDMKCYWKDKTKSTTSTSIQKHMLFIRYI